MSDIEVIEIVKRTPEVITIDDTDTSEPEIIDVIDITKRSRKRSKKSRKKKNAKSAQLPHFIPISNNHHGTKKSKKKRRQIVKSKPYMNSPVDKITSCQVHNVEIQSNVFIIDRNEPRRGLRPVIIDAAYVATMNGSFSMCHLWKCINYFIDKGHKNIAAFLMPFHEFPSREEERNILDQLRTMNYVYTVPLKRIDQHVVDISMGTHLVQYAVSTGGVIISNRIFREEEYSNPEWRNIINCRLINVVWMNGTFMLPEYPFNLGGPKLNEVLSFPRCICPQ